MELLEAIMKELQVFVNESDCLVNVVFDEFQEIVALPDAAKIEAIMRTHIQQYQASHFYVGSRRRLLQNMFNDEQRPFFHSSLNFQLPELPSKELVPFLVGLFAQGGKRLSAESALALVSLASCHPHYTIKLSFHVFEQSVAEVTDDDIFAGLRALLSDDHNLFDSWLGALPPRQRLLLRALAKEPTDKLMATDYGRKHDLGSSTGIAHSGKQLQNLDYIEEGKDHIWRVVDPMFSRWLAS